MLRGGCVCIGGGRWLWLVVSVCRVIIVWFEGEVCMMLVRERDVGVVREGC